jgi:hypothetical protein
MYDYDVLFSNDLNYHLYHIRKHVATLIHGHLIN